MMQGLPDFHGQDIIGNTFVNALNYQLQGVLCIYQLLVVPHICNHGAAGANFIDICFFKD